MEDKIREEIGVILSKIESLESMTVKDVRMQLEWKLGMSLKDKKHFIADTIGNYLAEREEDIPPKEVSEVAHFDVPQVSKPKKKAPKLAEVTTPLENPPAKKKKTGRPAKQTKQTQMDTEWKPDGKKRKQTSTPGKSKKSQNAKRLKTTPKPEAPPKPKRELSQEEQDLEFARQLQAQDTSRTRRGQQQVYSQLSAKPKAEKQEQAPKPKPKRKGKAKPAPYLSEALSEFVGGDTQMHRGEVVKMIWDHVKKHNLQDPSDGRFILNDPALKAVFKRDRMQIFKMNKYLSSHMKDPRLCT